MRGGLAVLAAVMAAEAAALDGAALRHYAAGESARANDAPHMAMGHFGKALAILEQEGRAESEDAARLLDEMAALALRQGERARAARWLERALAVTARAVGRDHPDYSDRAARLAALGE
jgi:hypothetical protein